MTGERAMATWQITGRYMETCNCALGCPCILTNLAGSPTEGDCKAAWALQISDGEKDGVRLDGVTFIVVLQSDGPIANGNIKVGLIIDEAASEEQVEAIGAIASGIAGGPMAALSSLVGEMVGIERRPISFEQDGLGYSVKAGELVDQELAGVPSMSNQDEPIYIDNVAHPVSSKLALAKANRSSIHAFGIDWDDASGTRNGNFAPFSWSG